MSQGKNLMKGAATLAVLTTTALYLNACSSGNSGGGASRAGTPVKLNAVVSDAATFSIKAIGGSTTSSLNALKYMVSNISLCESLTANGSGFTNPQNCSQIYSANLPGTLTDSTLPIDMTVINDLQSGVYSEYQIDLMDPASRAKLNASASVTAGTYNYAIITWASPIQFNVSVTVGSNTFYSKSTTSVNGSKSTTTGDITTGPAQDAVVISPNGGTFFKFAQPFVVTDADVEERKEFVVDLVFNPDGVIRATDVPSNFSMSSWYKDSAGEGAMYVPMLSLAPVPREASDTNSKETYEITDNLGTVYRFEIYYNTSDADKKILGASLVSANGNMSDDAKITEITENAGKLDFASTASGMDPLKGFERSSTCAATDVWAVTVTGCSYIGTVVIQ